MFRSQLAILNREIICGGLILWKALMFLILQEQAMNEDLEEILAALLGVLPQCYLSFGYSKKYLSIPFNSEINS
jgi:hypothetical protein